MTENSALPFYCPKTIHHGVNALGSVVDEIKKMGGTKVLVVTDPGIVKAGLINRLLDLIKEAEIPFEVYEDVNPDPELRKVEACSSLLKDGGHNLVIGFGGGSSIDVAKFSSNFLVHSGAVRDYLGRNLLERKGLPIILIPTTAGTGSEATWAAVFHDERDHVKKAVWSPYLMADSVIVDPSLTVSMPSELTLDTGMDALIHCLEAAVAMDASPLTDSLAIGGISLISRGFRKVAKDGSDLEARYDMALAATMAGMAFCNAGLGAIHALALPLDAEYGFTHGRSLTVLTPAIMDFNLDARPAKYAQIARALGEATGGLGGEEEAGRKASSGVIKLANDVGVSMKLRDYHIKEEQLEDIGKRAYKVGQRLFPMNPKPLTEADVIQIYKNAY